VTICVAATEINAAAGPATTRVNPTVPSNHMAKKANGSVKTALRIFGLKKFSVITFTNSIEKLTAIPEMMIPIKVSIRTSYYEIPDASVPEYEEIIQEVSYGRNLGSSSTNRETLIILLGYKYDGELFVVPDHRASRSVP
jgi:hypothetical protein